MADPSARVVLRHLTAVTLMHKERSGRKLSPEETAALQEARKALRRERVDVVRRGLQRGR